METSIQKNYFDALFYANATITEKSDIHISPVEFKLLLKLIHYSSNQKNITWQTKDIAIHTSMNEGAIDKAIQRLRQKGYINTTTYNNSETTKKRTIFINWDMIQLVDTLYNEQINNNNQASLDIEAEQIAKEDMRKEDFKTIIEDDVMGTLVSNGKGSLMFLEDDEDDEEITFEQPVKEYKTAVDIAIEEAEKKRADKENNKIVLSTITKKMFVELGEPESRYEEYIQDPNNYNSNNK